MACEASTSARQKLGLRVGVADGRVVAHHEDRHALLGDPLPRLDDPAIRSSRLPRSVDQPRSGQDGVVLRRRAVEQREQLVVHRAAVETGLCRRRGWVRSSTRDRRRSRTCRRRACRRPSGPATIAISSRACESPITAMCGTPASASRRRTGAAGRRCSGAAHRGCSSRSTPAPSAPGTITSSSSGSGSPRPSGRATRRRSTAADGPSARRSPPACCSRSRDDRVARHHAQRREHDGPDRGVHEGGARAGQPEVPRLGGRGPRHSAWSGTTRRSSPAGSRPGRSGSARGR